MNNRILGITQYIYGIYIIICYFFRIILFIITYIIIVIIYIYIIIKKGYTSPISMNLKHVVKANILNTFFL